MSLRHLVWSVGDSLNTFANRLSRNAAGIKPSDDIIVSTYEMTLAVDCTAVEADEISEQLMDVLCGGYDDGKHHVCIRSTFVVIKEE